MHSNQDTIFDWYDFLKHDLKPDKVNFNYIRTPSADPIELDIDLTRYSKLAQMIDDDSRHAAIKNNYGGNAGFFKAAIDIYMHGLIAKTQETQKAQLTCYAGTAGAVIYDEGTLSSCENLAPIGNLRDHDWNFQGMIQEADFAMEIGRRVANLPALPKFNPNDEFAKSGKR